MSVAVTTLTSAPSLARIFATSALTAYGKKGSALPDRSLRLEGVRVDRGHLLAYQRVCGFGVSDVLPHTYPHILGFPLQAAVMSARDFPMALPGMVHLANTITVHRRLTADDVLDITVSATDLRPHAKGRLVDLVAEVDVAGEAVWWGRSTYLSRGRSNPDAPQEAAAPDLPGGDPVAVLRIPGDIGRRYAAVSGDVNPIHLHLLTAKAMGFPRAIAHGMWTGARTIAAVSNAAADPSTSQIWFKKPVLLPSTVEITRGRSGAAIVAGLPSHKNPETEHLVLTLS
ncbi:MAG: MaoC/PaaZ C-terminal domain-containing protein [Nostocoides sp.]